MINMRILADNRIVHRNLEHTCSESKWMETVIYIAMLTMSSDNKACGLSITMISDFSRNNY